jgi:ABC-type phosphate transport system substrate-binding protein
MAAMIGTASAQAGYIGYVGANFTKPYTQTVTAQHMIVDAPRSAALQNENLRVNGVYLPVVGGSTLTFIAPTPGGALNAWNDTRLQPVASTWTWADYNIYNNTFTSTTFQGGIMLHGQSVLPLTNVVGAYPLSGATFMDLYSCYNAQADALRATNLRNFLNWLFGATGPVQASLIQNSGFNPVPPAYAAAVRAKYLGPLNVNSISSLPSNILLRGCTGVTGGAL